MSDAKEPRSRMRPEIRKAIVSWIVGAAGGLVGYGALIFLAAGRLDWVWGWVCLAVMGAGLAAHPILLLPRDPALLAERSRGIRAKGTKTWDRWIVVVATVLLLASILVASLEVRWSGPAHGPLALNLGGLLASILGWAMLLWAMTSNAYFAEGVRIQSERGHTVSTAGPYRYVRHPGYIGSMLIVLGTPLLLGSWWALILGGLAALLLVVRTALEDRTLQAELPGYTEYAQQTRYRLLPGVW